MQELLPKSHDNIYAYPSFLYTTFSKCLLKYLNHTPPSLIQCCVCTRSTIHIWWLPWLSGRLAALLVMYVKKSAVPALILSQDASSVMRGDNTVSDSENTWWQKLIRNTPRRCLPWATKQVRHQITYVKKNFGGRESEERLLERDVLAEAYSRGS